MVGELIAADVLHKACGRNHGQAALHIAREHPLIIPPTDGPGIGIGQPQDPRQKSGAQRASVDVADPAPHFGIGPSPDSEVNMPPRPPPCRPAPFQAPMREMIATGSIPPLPQAVRAADFHDARIIPEPFKHFGAEREEIRMRQQVVFEDDPLRFMGKEPINGICRPLATPQVAPHKLSLHRARPIQAVYDRARLEAGRRVSFIAGTVSKDIHLGRPDGPKYFQLRGQGFLPLENNQQKGVAKAVIGTSPSWE